MNLRGYETALIEIINRKYLIIKGLTVKNAGPGNNTNGILVYKSSFISLVGNYTYNTVSSGIGVWSSDNITVETPENVDVNVSILTLGEVEKYYSDIAGAKDIPHRFPEEGCNHRAFEISSRLELRGIQTAHVFAVGDLYVKTDVSPKGFVEWGYHVAPMVFVKVNNVTIPYIIDPAMFDHPVPLEVWQKKQLDGPGSKIEQTIIRSRFAKHHMGPQPQVRTVDSIVASKCNNKVFLSKQNNREM